MAQTQYRIYNPSISSGYIMDAWRNPHGLKHAANPDIAWYGDTFYAVMDASSGLIENDQSSRIWLYTSANGTDWSEGVKPFYSDSLCHNPVTEGPNQIEMQPVLVEVNSQLWCGWNRVSLAGTPGIYLSILDSPTGKWFNQRVEFTGITPSFSDVTVNTGKSPFPTFNGISDWLPFFSQRPIALMDGRVAFPLILMSPTNFSTNMPAEGIVGRNDFNRYLKFPALLFVDPAGDMSAEVKVIDPGECGDSAAWEIFAVQNPAEHITVFWRSLDSRMADEDFMWTATSYDKGQSFTAARSTKMLVPSARGIASRASSRRWLMTHVDHPQMSNKSLDAFPTLNNRMNGALFVSRRGGDDFVPGINISGDDAECQYPALAVDDDGRIVVVYGSGPSGLFYRSGRYVVIDSVPSPNYSYVHPRSNNVYYPLPSGIDLITETGWATHPALHDDATPPFWRFNGFNQMRSADELTAPTAVSFSMWVKLRFSSTVLVDTRKRNAPDLYGPLLLMSGMALPGMGFGHGSQVSDEPLFMAGTVDNATQTITTWIALGDGQLVSRTGHYRSLLFSDNPIDGEAITVNLVTYTFRNSPSTANHVQIGDTTYDTLINLQTTLAANSVRSIVQADSTRIVMSRNDLASFTVTASASSTVESGITIDGNRISIGSKSIGTSSTLGLVGDLYEARIYDMALTAANVTYLHNNRCADFGYAAIAGTSTAPPSAVMVADPANPDDLVWPPVPGTVPVCEVLDANHLRIQDKASAAVELPHGVNEITIFWKLSQASQEITIATFGTINQPARLFLRGNTLSLEDKVVGTINSPTSYTSTTLTVSTGKVKVGETEIAFSGKPRMFLGDAYPQNFSQDSDYIDFDILAMSVKKA